MSKPLPFDSNRDLLDSLDDGWGSVPPPPAPAPSAEVQRENAVDEAASPAPESVLTSVVPAASSPPPPKPRRAATRAERTVSNPTRQPAQAPSHRSPNKHGARVDPKEIERRNAAAAQRKEERKARRIEKATDRKARRAAHDRDVAAKQKPRRVPSTSEQRTRPSANTTHVRPPATAVHVAPPRGRSALIVGAVLIVLVMSATLLGLVRR